ncbi:efflux RND transporter periplasmic adaptor subunit [Zobellia uliginosa]|mgnify:CR=1 FL=1|uniref:efflux RND transporter periplasmic adaptor subunit n=1 Tax=Zobellia uliginosa TaxID=143224 RepID=UPI001C0766C0|nr:efflux RND transporter periplasmic adaptor subunit [Zobellia uliginosa]MBU2945188.1 efflux RND transporter periplasmic adaptor subunit [Zobellia uliginosa]
MRRIFMLISLSALLFHSSCQSEKKHKEKEAKYLVTNPILMDTVITKNYVCQIHSYRNIELRALEKGYLQTIFVDEGQHVKKDQPMFKIMDKVYKSELQRADAEAEVAKIEYKNTQLLADSDVVSPNELAMSKAKYEKAKAEVAMAQTHLGFTDIRAPFDGIIDHLLVREGSLLDEGELLTSLSDNSKMWVYFNVSEAEYLNYALNGNSEDKIGVELLMANNQKFDQEGIVETIEGEFNNETGNIAFRATFPNPKGLLRHGETGSILMKLPLKDVMIIPQKATFEVLDKKFVFVVDESNIVHRKEVTVSSELPHLFVVQEGLSKNDKVLLEGIRLVKEGSHIEPDFMAPKKQLALLDLYAE